MIGMISDEMKCGQTDTEVKYIMVPNKRTPLIRSFENILKIGQF